VSREDVETVRASYEALNRGDIDGSQEALHPDVEWRESRELPETGVYHGRASVRRFLEEFLESWDEFRQDVEEVIEADGKVVVFLHLSARGRESGVSVDARYAHVWTMRDGKAVRVDAYYDREEALEAARSGRARGAANKA
jgi:ketosteroid isomerase-like protein